MSRNDRRRVELAARAAGRSDCKHEHGAVLVAGGRILAAAPNRQRNGGMLTRLSESTTHAEEAVLRVAKDNAAGATLYVVRVNKQGAFRDSRPCRRCHVKIMSAGISRVVYTTSDGEFVSMRPGLHNIPEPRRGHDQTLDVG